MNEILAIIRISRNYANISQLIKYLILKVTQSTDRSRFINLRKIVHTGLPVNHNDALRIVKRNITSGCTYALFLSLKDPYNNSDVLTRPSVFSFIHYVLRFKVISLLIHRTSFTFSKAIRFYWYPLPIVEAIRQLNLTLLTASLQKYHDDVYVNLTTPMIGSVVSTNNLIHFWYQKWWLCCLKFGRNWIFEHFVDTLTCYLCQIQGNQNGKGEQMVAVQQSVF